METSVQSPVAEVHVALQQEIDIGRLGRGLAEKGIRRWVYIGEDAAWRVRAEESVGPDVPRVSIAEMLDRKSWELRQPYIDWIGQLSATNDSLEWWASSLSEKNPFDKLYVRICMLSCAMQLIRNGIADDTLMICSTPGILAQVERLASDQGMPIRVVTLPKGTAVPRRVLQGSRRYFRHPYRLLKSLTNRLLDRVPPAMNADPGYRRSVLTKLGVDPKGDFSGRDSILLFTWVDGRNFSPTGGYQDPHLGQLAELLRRQGYRIAYVPQILPLSPFEQTVERLLDTGERLFFPESFASLEDIEACRLRAGAYKVSIPPDSHVGTIPVYDLAVEQVERDRQWLAESLTYESLIAGLSTSAVVPRQIIHTCEGHSWEQVVAWSVRRYMPGTKIVGYDSGTFSRMQLSMYPAVCERGIRPMPERIVANGQLARNALVADGHRPEVAKGGCAMRSSSLASPPYQSTNSGRYSNKAPLTILVATSIHFGHSLELVYKAAQALGGQPGTEVLVKCHPMVDARQLIRSLGKAARHRNIHFVDTPINELLPAVPIMLYTYTNVCFDALYHGAMPIFVRSENGLSMDKLEAAPEVRWTATSPEDLRRVVGEIAAMSDGERAAWQERATGVLRKAFSPVTPECVEEFVI